MPPNNNRRRTNNNNNRKNKKHDNNKTRQQLQHPSIVGPDSIQILQGNLFNKKISLILCGETHEDAIDVTRKGGIFDAKEGWIELPKEEILFDFMMQTTTTTTKPTTTTTMTSSRSNYNADIESLMMRIFANSGKKSLAIGSAQDWAKTRLESLDLIGQVILLWVQETQPEARVPKGKAYLLGFTSVEALDENDEEYDEWINPRDGEKQQQQQNNNNNNNNNNPLPTSVVEWILPPREEEEEGSEASSQQQQHNNNKKFRSFEWGDMDPQAFELNRRRLTDEEIETAELDQIIEDRKMKLRNENIWTWDDWFKHIREKNNKNTNKPTDDTAAIGCCDIDLIIESSVPPWELSLHRPNASEDIEKITIPPAADFIRRMPEDEDGDIEDLYDPSNDGVGSYLDYTYRTFMEEMIREFSDGGEKKNDIDMKSTWLHCVDVRDLGCQSACHSDSVKEMWKGLLSPDEAIELIGKEGTSEKNQFIGLEADESNQYIKFVPECRMNPERIELENMRSTGILKSHSEDDEDDDEEEDPEEGEDFTFPSFEGFFGQSTDFLYYSPHVNLYYSPFLAKNVKSFANWEHFFTALFLGGTIPDALSVLDLHDKKDHLYVRSPIQKTWNEETEDFEFAHRDDSEHYITYPFFPFLFYLYAKGSNPPRTYSSHLLAQLCKEEGSEPERVATAAREWTCSKIQQHCSDPKASDDPQCGGEWFGAYLYAVHRDIYEDIDHSDTTILLQRNKVKSLSSGRKYNLGKIQIPTCKEGFDEITECFGMTIADEREQIVTPRVEVLAKILLDIWMSCLVDFTTVLKITELMSKPSNNKNAVIAVYMGAAHTRALTEFWVNHMGFKKKTFVGKTVWDENEPRTLRLPNTLWDIEKLFT